MFTYSNIFVAVAYLLKKHFINRGNTNRKPVNLDLCQSKFHCY